ncbi:DUF6286 domain-containing protein [Arthrobacter glacialis]|uniref:DUF6286 domain-containing protein n=1 Tax=Arthrobacter glacialis TaxID=1664 RepID=UPI00105748CE|nr:DUF6286 domain-containing protein [Arthrobacter glacialis]
MSNAPASKAPAKLQRAVRRLGLRETHSSRAALSIVTAAVLVAVLVWLMVEMVLSATGNAALLMSPAELARRTATVATETIPGALVAAGTVLAVLGIALLAAAVVPGRKARHIMGNPGGTSNPRSAVVVDSEVLAAAVSRIARTVAKIAPEQVSSSVGRKRIDVVLQPGSGLAADADSVKDAVEREVAGYGLRRPLAVTVSTPQTKASLHQAVGA